MLPIVSVPAVIVWLAAVPPKIAESPAFHDPRGAEVTPLSQLPPESQFVGADAGVVAGAVNDADVAVPPPISLTADVPALTTQTRKARGRR